MDGTPGLTMVQKGAELLKAAAIWMLLATLFSALLLWLYPAFYDPLPKGVRSAPPFIWISVIFTAFKILDTVLDRGRASRVQRLERSQQQLIKIYRPMAAFFLTCHVTLSGPVRPRWRDRVLEAREQLHYYKRRRSCMKHAWRALFPKLALPRGEVEFGGGFPIGKIVSLVEKQAVHVDEKLMGYVRRADRSLYERQVSDGTY